MGRIDKLKDELTVDPLGRGYSGMSDQQVVDDLALVNRNAPAAAETIRSYCLLEEKGGTNIWGRIQIVAESSVGDDPIGESVVLTLDHIAAAKAFMEAIANSSSFSFDLSDTRFDRILSSLAAGQGCKAIAAADKTAIQNFSINQQSRATELGLGTVRVGTVQQARA